VGTAVEAGARRRRCGGAAEWGRCAAVARSGDDGAGGGQGRGRGARARWPGEGKGAAAAAGGRHGEGRADSAGAAGGWARNDRER
jgi:hypothetical protein